MTGPRNEPLGLQVISTGQLIGRAFDEALAGAGGSLPQWLVLVSLKGHDRHQHQHQHLAPAAGDDGDPPADQLQRMEADGLVRRTSGSQSGSAHQFELTDLGEATFNRLLKAVVAFDRRLRTSLADEESATLVDLLGRLRSNVSDPGATPEPP